MGGESSRRKNEDSRWDTFRRQGALPVLLYAVLRLASAAQGIQGTVMVSGGQSDPLHYHTMQACLPPPLSSFPLSPSHSRLCHSLCLSQPALQLVHLCLVLGLGGLEGEGAGSASKGVRAH